MHLKEKPFACELCPYRASRKQHIKVNQTYISPRIINPDNPCISPRSIACYALNISDIHSLLRQSRLRYSLIQSHMETHKRRQLLQGEAGKIKCPQCDYSHDDQFYIDCHVKLHHEGAEKLVCPHCDFSSLTTYRLTSLLIRT